MWQKPAFYALRPITLANHTYQVGDRVYGDLKTLTTLTNQGVLRREMPAENNGMARPPEAAARRNGS